MTKKIMKEKFKALSKYRKRKNKNNRAYYNRNKEKERKRKILYRKKEKEKKEQKKAKQVAKELEMIEMEKIDIKSNRGSISEMPILNVVKHGIRISRW